VQHLEGAGGEPVAGLLVPRLDADEDRGDHVVRRQLPVVDPQLEDLLEAVERVAGGIRAGERRRRGQRPTEDDDASGQNQNVTSVPMLWKPIEAIVR
jgi:hypothetical protein